jgi:hypothetical protein
VHRRSLTLLPLLLLAACRGPRLGGEASVAPESTASSAPAAPAGLVEGGAAPGGERGPGGFVPRGSMRSFYAGAGGRLWYYLNNYYWVPAGASRDDLWSRDLWIRAEVAETFTDLRRWPDGAAAPPTTPKTTVEYWKVGPGGRSVRLDNHKDYCLLSDGYTAGAIEVRVTLTLGRVHVRDEAGRWGDSKENYVLESRNYREREPGIGAERTRFAPLAGEPVNVWGYRIPWSTHPERLTRSTWLELPLPTWRLLEQRRPERASPPPVTAGDVADHDGAR